ncbi:ectonucleotide pyrophosphatase/phosphodiesterase [Lysobacter koreensis]|uniref:Ectonucleotide pyrophosphatase/phosphodiesterase n=1 Tax=Lysobacter koreensis TaxID=266122 RepID=A0ABW2YPW9_9GAMM
MPANRLAATAALLVLLLSACATAPRPRTPPAGAEARMPIAGAEARMPIAGAEAPAAILLLSIDAFRPDYLALGITPNLARVAREGVRAAWMNPSYPSLTFPNHYTIVTGLRPDRHGIVHNTMRDAALGTFTLSDREAVGDGRWWGGEPLWVSAENAGLPTATLFWPGSEAAVRGVRPRRWSAFDKRMPLAARVDTVLGWLREGNATRPRFTTMYFDTLDSASHDFGPDSRQAHAAIREVDAALGRLLDGLATGALLERVNLVIVSDHGMATVAPGHAIAIEDMVPARDARAVSDGQALGFAPLPGRERAAEARLLGRHAHHECWRKADLPARWRYGRHPRVPTIVCQMDEGWDALRRASLAKRPPAATRGSHGFDPALPSMRAIFLARGPAFRSGAQLPAFDNVDVYPLLARLIGITPVANDGDIAPLLPALRRH